MMRRSAEAGDFVARRAERFGKGKAISLLAHKIGRAVYHMLRRHQGLSAPLTMQTTRQDDDAFCPISEPAANCAGQNAWSNAPL